MGDLGRYWSSAPTQVKMAPFWKYVKIVHWHIWHNGTKQWCLCLWLVSCWLCFCQQTFAKSIFLVFWNTYCLHQLKLFIFSSFIDALWCNTPFYSDKSVPQYPCACGLQMCSHTHADDLWTIRLIKTLFYSATSGWILHAIFETAIIYIIIITMYIHLAF